jgi:hypothetical protein
MPREDAVSAILERAKEFERQMQIFLGHDYDGANPDRAPYPDTRSLIGKSGEFLLYRLTGSSLFSSLISSIDIISTVAQDVLADTPGKAAFEWIRKAVSWIDSLRSAVIRKSYSTETIVDKLVISEKDAREILENGKSFFLDLPEDLRKTLSTHGILLSTNKVEERLTVVFKKGGAHHSIGGTAIRWCPVLFDSLREDITRLERWKNQVQEIQDDFSAFSSERKETSSDDEAVLTRLHGFSEEVSMLVEEGVESLVVAPPNEIVDSLHELLSSLEIQLRSDENRALHDRIARRSFEDPDALLEDRFCLLDSLTCRSAVEFQTHDGANQFPFDSVEISEGTFRDTCRTFLEKALRKGLQLMGLQPESEEMVEFTFCAVKAWEIEFEMYARFQANFNENVISPEYREKARTLRWVLEDCMNPKLCCQVLLGEIEASELVSMPEKQIVGSRLKIDFVEPSLSDDKEEASETTASSPAGSESESIDDTKVVKEDAQSASSRATEVVDATASDAIAVESKTACNQQAKPPPELKLLPLVEEPIRVAKLEDSQTKPPSPLPRPYAPPSLAASLAPPSLAASLVSSGSSKTHPAKKASAKVLKKGKYVTNSDGDDTFLCSVSKPTLKFVARFYMENEAHASLCGFLPPNLTERGRLRVDEFAKFLAGKLKKGGRWVGIPMRLSVYSEEDAKQHKKFYKEYETAKRIAMFAIGEHSKVFFVTPKFHRAASKALGRSFNVETSTYAVVLTREKLPVSRH